MTVGRLPHKFINEESTSFCKRIKKENHTLNPSRYTKTSKFSVNFCIRKTARFLPRLPYYSLQFFCFHFHTISQFPHALYGEGRNIIKLFSYISYVIHNSSSLTTDCIPIPYALVNLLIS